MDHDVLNVVWLPIGEKELALNPATGDWLLADPDGKKLFLAAAAGKDPLDLQNEFPFVSRNEISSLLNAMKQMDFRSVRDCGPAHYCDDCHQGRFPRLAVLNLTEDCNLNCTYCYVRAGEKKKAWMQPETAFQIVDEFLAMNADDEKSKITIVMHGGEPLLNYDVVEKLTQYVQPCRDRIDLSIQTNATLLTEERVRFLLDNGVSVGVSLDGPPEIHNLTRPFPNGRESFEQVMRGIRMLQSHGINVGVISVMTRRFAEQIDHVLDFFLENQIYNLSFSPFLKVGRGMNDEENFVTPDILFDAYKRLLDRIVMFNTRADRPCDLSENHLTQIARKVFSNQHDFMCTRAPCGSGRDILGFGMNGDFYTCDDFINDPDFRIGSLDQGSVKEQLLHTDVIRTLCNRSMAELPRCRDCIWRSLCGGICHSADYYSGANGVEETAMCGFYKKLIPYLIETFIQIPELPVLLGAQPRPVPKKTLFFDLYDKDDPEEQLNGEEFAELLRFHGINRHDTVFFCGSEPTLLPGFPELLCTAAKLSSGTVLSTNGMAFTNEAYVRLLFQSGLQNVLIIIPDTPEERTELYKDLDIYFRIRQEAQHSKSHLILRVKASSVDNRILPVLKQLHTGDQLNISGTNPQKVNTKDISPLMKKIVDLGSEGIVRFDAGKPRNTKEEKSGNRVLMPYEPSEKLIWIDSGNFAGKELTEFPAGLQIAAT